jgi:hypothetical protein
MFGSCGFRVLESDFRVLVVLAVVWRFDLSLWP